MSSLFQPNRESKKIFGNLDFKVSNYGITHAFNVSLSAIYTITKTQHRPFMLRERTVSMTIPITIKSDTEFITEPWQIPITVFDFQTSDLEAGKAFAHVAGTLHYRDVFDNPQTTNFHFLCRALVNTIDGVGENGDETITMDLSEWTRPPNSNHST